MYAKEKFGKFSFCFCRIMNKFVEFQTSYSIVLNFQYIIKFSSRRVIMKVSVQASSRLRLNLTSSVTRTRDPMVQSWKHLPLGHAGASAIQSYTY